MRVIHFINFRKRNRFRQARRNTLSLGGAKPQRGAHLSEVLGEGVGGGYPPPTVGTFSKIRV